MDQLILSTLGQIKNPKGDIFHIIKNRSNGFKGFGEAYFSTINYKEIKGWKKHLKMTLNLIVPIGQIEIVVYNEITNNFFNVNLSKNNYKRLTIPPDYWVAFRGLGKNENYLLNFANIEHDPEESINKELDSIQYNWDKL